MVARDLDSARTRPNLTEGCGSPRLDATGVGRALETTLENFGVDVEKERLRLSIQEEVKRRRLEKLVVHRGR